MRSGASWGAPPCRRRRLRSRPTRRNTGWRTRSGTSSTATSSCSWTDAMMNRRDFLGRAGGGFGGLALAAMLHEAEAQETKHAPHHAPRARRVIQLFMNGGASPMDTFDYKPELFRRHGQKVDF